MANSKRNKGTTAAEVQREFQARLKNDPDFAREMAARDAERRERVQGLRLAEQPIVQDLRNAGCEVSSVWDLVNTSVPYPDALPVLLAHLQHGGYPDRVMESMGRAMAVKPRYSRGARSATSTSTPPAQMRRRASRLP